MYALIWDFLRFSPMMFPKPLKKDRPNIRRRIKIKEKDREFQKESKDMKCIIMMDCLGSVSFHHKKKRRNMQCRWDKANTLCLCWKHHLEGESKGAKWFKEKYGIDFD